MTKKLNIHDVRKHSKLKKNIVIFNSIELVVRPFSIGIIQKVIPITAKLALELQGLGIFQKPLDQIPILEFLLSCLPVIERNQELFEEVITILYDSIQATNEFIIFEDEEYEFFSKEEFIKHIELPDIKAMIQATFEVNYTENPYLAKEIKTGVKSEIHKETVSKVKDLELLELAVLCPTLVDQKQTDQTSEKPEV